MVIMWLPERWLLPTGKEIVGQGHLSGAPPWMQLNLHFLTCEGLTCLHHHPTWQATWLTTCTCLPQVLQ
jgi:hypothetical protein